MLLSLDQRPEDSKPHLVLAVPESDYFDIQSVVMDQVLKGMSRPVVDLDDKSGDYLIRLNKNRYLERVIMTFPACELSQEVKDEWTELLESRSPIPNTPPRRLVIPGMSDDVELFDYQKIAVKWTTNFLRVNPGFIVSLDMGLGKGQPYSAKVLTPEGWGRIGDLKIGDQVIGSSGQVTEVLGIFPQKSQQVYRVTMSDGSSTRCDESHLWTVQTPLDKQRRPGFWSTVSVRQILNEEVVKEEGRRNWAPWLRNNCGNKQLSIPIVEPIQFSEKILPIDPYTLGVLLGDGCLSRPSSVVFDCGQDTAEIASLLIPVGEDKVNLLSDTHGSITGRRTLHALIEFGLIGCKSPQKFVPGEYMVGSIEQRLGLLQGLLDTDGYAMPDGGIEFSSTSENLKNSVIDLVRSLGGIARQGDESRITHYAYKGEKRYGLPSWRVNVKLPAEFDPFRTSRKADAFVRPTKYPPVRYIESIEPDGFEKTVCIKVDALDELYVTDDCIVTHNTAISLAVLARVKKIGLVTEPCLVVCPNGVKHSWHKMIQEWFPDLKSIIVEGTKDHRIKLLKRKADIYIINYEMMRTIAEYDKSAREWSYDPQFPQLMERQWGLFVADEVHRVKSSDAQATTGFFLIKAQKCLFLSGTPILNRPDEIWSPLHKLYPDSFGTHYGFTRALAVYKKSGKLVGYRPERLMELRDFLAQISYRKRKDQVLDDLPEVVYSTHTVELTQEQRKLYKQIQEDFKMTLADGTTKNILGVLPQITRLKQACFSPELYEGSRTSRKVDEVKDLVEEIAESGQKVLIFSQWSTAARIIERELSHYKTCYVDGSVSLKNREVEMDRFNNDPHVVAYIGTYGANKEGITLGAAQNVILTDKDWVPAAMEQAIARSGAGGIRGLHLGPDAKINVIEIQAENTIEQWIEELLAGKSSTVNRMVERDAGAHVERIRFSSLKELMLRGV